MTHPRQEVDEERDSKPGAFNDGFANENLGVYRNALAPIHCHPTSGYQPRPVAAVSVPPTARALPGT